MNTSTDRIERKILLKAPRARVWRALSDAPEFGGWFGVDFKGKLGKFGLGRFRPRLDTPQNVLEFFCCHMTSLA